jgi:hypothetical protein
VFVERRGGGGGLDGWPLNLWIDGPGLLWIEGPVWARIKVVSRVTAQPTRLQGRRRLVARRGCPAGASTSLETVRAVDGSAGYDSADVRCRGSTVKTRLMWSLNSDMKSLRNAAVSSLDTWPSASNTSGE